MQLDMISAYRADMLGFFEELAAEAPGWSGTKQWRSEFAEMYIDAANPGDGVAVLDVLIRWPPTYEEERSATIHVRADEFARFAARMRAFLRMPHRGSRFTQ